jgi:hypothetical protein
MLPRCCIVIDFFLDNQPDAIIIRIYSFIKLYVSRASSLPIIRSFSTVHSVLVSFTQVFDDRFQAESGCMKLTNAECTVEKLLMMGREDARNM